MEVDPGTSSLELQDLTRSLVQLRSGDRAGFETLVRQTEARFFRFCFRLTGDEARAEELFQEAYIKAFEKMQELERPERIMPWLHTVAKNLFIDSIRRVSNRNEVLSDVTRTNATGFIERAQDLSHADRDLVVSVRDAMSRLSPDERIVITLVDLEGYSYDEAAEIVGIKEPALRSRLARARKAFLGAYDKGRS